MKILLVKMSSLGDIIHTFPALSDAADRIRDLQIDWVVEEAFSEMPKWHPKVRKVIPIAWRRWKKNFKQAIQTAEIKTFLNNLKAESYDYIIDAQGLLKSAVVAKLANGNNRCGFDAHSARESIASCFYQNRYSIDPYQPVVRSIRELFAKALNYPLPDSVADFGLNLAYLEEIPQLPLPAQKKYWVFLHGTSHINKEWPLAEWIKLASLATEEGFEVYLPWGNPTEQDRAKKIADSNEHVHVLPKLNICQIARLLSLANAVVGLDTGFSHLAAAFRVPTLAIYRASNPRRVCITGDRQQFIEALHPSSCKNSMPSKRGIYDACSCFQNIQAERVFNKIKEISMGYQGVFKKN